MDIRIVIQIQEIMIYRCLAVYWKLTLAPVQIVRYLICRSKNVLRRLEPVPRFDLGRVAL